MIPEINSLVGSSSASYIDDFDAWFKKYAVNFHNLDKTYTSPQTNSQFSGFPHHFIVLETDSSKIA